MSMVFVVDQRHMAVVSARGDAAPTLAGPGLHVKLPPPLQTVTSVDTRIQSLDTPDEVRYTTSDKTELLVNPVVKFRVSNPVKLVAETKGDVQSLPDRIARTEGVAGCRRLACAAHGRGGRCHDGRRVGSCIATCICPLCREFGGSRLGRALARLLDELVERQVQHVAARLAVDEHLCRI